MLHRRDFLRSSSLVALGPLVPAFVARTAGAAEAGKDRILILLEMTGGNDGLNTVVPFRDDNYYKARPTIGIRKEEVLRVNDDLGLNPALQPLHALLQKGQLAIVQGVGYPNPDRSHFESMDIWQSADPRRKLANGWLGRGLDLLKVGEGKVPGICVGREQLPLALQGSATGVPAIQTGRPYDLRLGNEGTSGPTVVSARRRRAQAPDPFIPPVTDEKTAAARRAERLRLIRDMADLSPAGGNDLHAFVRRSSLETYATLDRLRELLQAGAPGAPVPPPPQLEFVAADGSGQLGHDLGLVARLIKAGFGTRVFYVAIDGFDTHANQRVPHDQLLMQMSNAIGNLFTELEKSGDAGRVLLMTFSEFGRRVQENGSHGTDHGAGSCLFLAGPGVKPGPHGKHPGLGRDELDSGDLRFHTDFRRVYATLLDRWLGCDSRIVLGDKFETLDLIK